VRSIYVPLREGAIPSLVELAQRELRDPKAQAVALILDGLRRAGLDVDPIPPAGVPLPAGKGDR
jgi:hypothetical protein